MSKKKNKKKESLKNAAIKEICRQVRREGVMTRNTIRSLSKKHYKELINNLYKVGQITLDTRNMIIKQIEEAAPAVHPEQIQAKVAKIKGFSKKKIKKYVKKQVIKSMDEYLDTFDETFKGLEKILDDLIKSSKKEQGCECKDECKDQDIRPRFQVIHVGGGEGETGLEAFENFCKNVLNVPPEMILGPDYKKIEDRDESKASSEPKKEDQENTPEDENLPCDAEQLDDIEKSVEKAEEEPKVEPKVEASSDEKVVEDDEEGEDD